VEAESHAGRAAIRAGLESRQFVTPRKRWWLSEVAAQSESLHLPDRGQSNRLVLGELTMLNDVEHGITAKPASFALIAALALGPVVKPGSDQVGVRTVHVATLDAAKK
jgi:hypothetical protein